MGKGKKLNRKMAAICGVFVLVLSVTQGLLGVYTYKKNVREQYERYVETIIRITASYIDVGDMIQCIETGAKTEYYEQTQMYLNNIRTRSNVEYLYVIRPLNTEGTDNSMYVWNAVTPEEQEAYQEIDSLGDLSGEGFTGKMAESFMAAMENGDEVAFYVNNTADFGYMLTGMYPLRTADGRTAALACVDISMNQIYQDIMQYILLMLCGTLVVGAIFMFVVLRADQSKQADRR